MPAKRPLNDPFLSKVTRERDRPAIPIADVVKYVQGEDAAFYLEFFTTILLVANYGAAKNTVPVSPIAKRTPYTDIPELLSSPVYQGYDDIAQMFRDNRIGSGMPELFQVLIGKWFQQKGGDLSSFSDPKTLVQRSGSTYYDFLPLHPDQLLMLRSWVSEDQIWQVILSLRQATGTVDTGTSDTAADRTNRLVAGATTTPPAKKATHRPVRRPKLSEILQAKSSVNAFFGKFQTLLVKILVDTIEVDVEVTSSSSGIAVPIATFFKALGKVIGAPSSRADAPGVGVATIALAHPGRTATSLFFQIAGEVVNQFAETKVTAIATVSTGSDLFQELSNLVYDTEKAVNDILDRAADDQKYSKEEVNAVKRHFDRLSDAKAQYVAGYKWNFFQWCEFFIYQLNRHLDLTIETRMDISYSGTNSFNVTGHSFGSNHRKQVFANFSALMKKLSLPTLDKTVQFWQTWYIDLLALTDPRELPTDLGTLFVLVYEYDDKRSGDLRGSKTYTFSSALVYRPSEVPVVQTGTRDEQIFASFMQQWLKDDRSGTEYQTFSKIAAGVGSLPATPVWPLIDRSWASEPVSARR